MYLHALDLRVIDRPVARARSRFLDRVHGVHPELIRPKTVCFPSSQGAASVVTMKNWLPFVSGPAFAIASAPGTTCGR